jgi:PAS domain S-box-containing protein
MKERSPEAKIKSLLKDHPKGLTISKISSCLRTNRNSIAKYLEVLQMAGQVESRVIGTAKVFNLAHRIPTSALLNRTSDLVCIIDNRNCVLYANKKFIEFFGLQNREISGQILEDIPHSIPDTPPFVRLFSDVLRPEETVKEITVLKNKRRWHLKIRGIPTVYDDGSSGTTIFIEDVTRVREYIHDLEFLTRTSAALADIGENENIYQYIVDRIAELIPESIVSVYSIDLDTRLSKCEAAGGDEGFYKPVFQELGTNLKGFTMDIDNIPEAMPVLMMNALTEGPGKLYSLVYQMIPEEVCNRIDERYALGKDFIMGCVCRGGLFGNVTIKLKKGAELRNQETIEAFVKQAGVALQRRHMREKLRRAEEELRKFQNTN